MDKKRRKDDFNFKIQMVAIASAARALEYRRAHPHVQDNEVIKYITSVVDEIIKQCDA